MTPEQILSLAPDSSSAAAGKGLANARKWQNLGADGRALWGECQGSGSKPYQTQIDTAEPAFKCSCPSRKFPCKHGLGLYLLYAAQANLFTQNTPPEWVQKWLETRQERAEKTAQKAEAAAQKEADPAQAAKRAASRENKVDKGLQELELWLGDLVRAGLAGAPSQPYKFWDTMAARLVDAQCPTLARRVRELAGVASMGSGWQEEMLARLAKIHLVIQGWKRRETLESDLVAELRTQIGFTIKEDDLDTSGAFEDEWWVLGQRTEEEEGLRVLRTWLWGRESNRPALNLQFAHVSQALAPQFMNGTRVRGMAVFYPGAFPLRFSLRERSAAAPFEGETPFGGGIAESAAQFAAALARNPWLEAFPVVIKGATLLPDDVWRVRDAAGESWPITAAWQDAWQLLADSGGAPVTLFGEWNGKVLRPFGWHSGGEN